MSPNISFTFMKSAKVFPNQYGCHQGERENCKLKMFLLHPVVYLVTVIIGGDAKCLKGKGGCRGKKCLLPCGKTKKQRALSAVICLQGSR